MYPSNFQAFQTFSMPAETNKQRNCSNDGPVIQKIHNVKMIFQCDTGNAMKFFYMWGLKVIRAMSKKHNFLA